MKLDVTTADVLNARVQDWQRKSSNEIIGELCALLRATQTDLLEIAEERDTLRSALERIKGDPIPENYACIHCGEGTQDEECDTTCPRSIASAALGAEAPRPRKRGISPRGKDQTAKRMGPNELELRRLIHQGWVPNAEYVVRKGGDLAWGVFHEVATDRDALRARVEELELEVANLLGHLESANKARRADKSLIAELEAHVEALRAGLEMAEAHIQHTIQWIQQIGAPPKSITSVTMPVEAVIRLHLALARTPAQSLNAVKAEALEIVKQRLYASASKEKDQPYGYSMHPRQWAATCLECAAEDVSAMQKELRSEADRIKKGGE